MNSKFDLKEMIFVNKDYNKILEENNQKLRIIKCEKLTPTGRMEFIQFNNDLILIGRMNINPFLDCIENIQKFLEWDVLAVDKLYVNNNEDRILEREKYAHHRCSIGGINAQLLHPDISIKNMNSKNSIPWNKGKKGSQVCWSKGLTKENNKSLQSLSENRKGSKNPYYGKHLTDEQKKFKSDLMKRKILDGSFTPNTTNRNCYFRCEYNNEKYRSSWEAAFKFLNPQCEYEKVRIKYKQEELDRIYIIDFVDYENKVIYEIKPSNLIEKDLKYKMKYVEMWINENGFKFEIITEDYFIKNYNLLKDADFNEDIIRKLIPIKMRYENTKN